MRPPGRWIILDHLRYASAQIVGRCEPRAVNHFAFNVIVDADAVQEISVSCVGAVRFGEIPRDRSRAGGRVLLIDQPFDQELPLTPD